MLKNCACACSDRAARYKQGVRGNARGGRARGRTRVCEGVQLEEGQRRVLLAIIVLVKPPCRLDHEKNSRPAFQVFLGCIEDEAAALYGSERPTKGGSGKRDGTHGRALTR